MEKKEESFAVKLRQKRDTAHETWSDSLWLFVEKLEAYNSYYLKLILKEIKENAELAASERKSHFSLEVDTPLKNSVFKEEKDALAFEKKLADDVIATFCKETGFSANEHSEVGYISLTLYPGQNTFFIFGKF